MKRPSFFPLIILALTLILVTGFVFSSSPKQTERKIGSEVPVVSEEQYQSALTVVLKKFVTSYDTASDDTARAHVVDQTLATLLSMRVPSSEKDLHLALAIALQKMKQGFVSNPQDVSDGYAQIKTEISQTSWLHV
ncbi:MAG: hypothetical protein NTX72_02260 [Candidatus Uhrbacteria bacterium]|nr:hypothetical protein [Candidatus Uhrbacteria bacterium]